MFRFQGQDSTFRPLSCNPASYTAGTCVPDIFLSYNREDQARARLFAEAFQAHGLDVWWDTALTPGEAYDQVTEKALKEARAVVVLWSKKSVDSRWVRAEATLAGRNKTLVPVMIEPCERPIMFELTQTAELSHWKGAKDDKLWLAFVEDVRRFIAKGSMTQPPAAQDPIPAKLPSPAPSAQIRLAERRQVTVLNSAVTGAGEDELDPEDWREIVVAFQHEAARIVAQFGGRAGPAQGDAFVAFFGDEQAREDDAERAVRAGLALVDAAARSSAAPARCVRVGIDSGPIVVGGAGEATFGAALTLATRLQGQAEPGGVVISAATAALTEGYFALESLAGRAFAVTAARDARTRFDVSRARGLSGFVGRAGDMRLLEDALGAAAAGQGQVIGVVAEAGTGKSRLCFEFLEACRARGFQVFEGRAVAHGRNISFLPILDVFRAFFDVRPEDEDTAARAKIETRLMALDTKLKDVAPLVFDFLGVGDPARPSPTLDPEVRQRQLVGLMRHLIKLASAERPTVTLIEDLHWLDPASAQFLEHMVEARADTASLLLLNFRPEFRADWMQNSWYRQIPLSPLGRDAVGDLLADLLGADASIASLTVPIQARTGGNPFFVEEVVQTLIETGQLKGTRGAYQLVTPVAKLDVPPTVKAVLAARIDRLGERERRLLQAASVIGKDFSEPLLAAVAELEEAELSAALTVLRRAEFIHEQSLFPIAVYAFKHPLTQEVALGSLLKDRRRQLNAAVARAIEAQDAEHLDERAALLAHHWEEAGETLQAARWHRRAAEWIAGTNHIAANQHWTRVRALLSTLPDDPESAAFAISACQQLMNIGWRLGVGFKESDELLEQGLAHARAIDDQRAILALTISHGRARLGSDGDGAAWVEAVTTCHQAAQAANDLIAQANTHMWLVDAYSWAARWQDVIDAARDGIARYPRFALQDSWAGIAPDVVMSFWLSGALGWSGQLDAALRQYDHTARLSREDGTPEMVGYVLIWEAIMHHLLGDAAQVLGKTQAFEKLAQEIGDPPNLVGLVNTGYCCASLAAGRPAEAVGYAQAAADIFSRVEKQHQGMTTTYLAEALLLCGKWERAEAAALEAITQCRLGLRGNHEAMAHGVRARIFLRRDGKAGAQAAEAALAEAAALIAQTGTKSLAPHLLEWRAELAGALGDEALRAADLHEAIAAFETIGAPLHAERLRDAISP